MFSNFLSHFFYTIKLYYEGLLLFLKNNLWKHLTVPLILSLVLTGILYLSYKGGHSLLSGLQSLYPFYWGSGFVKGASERADGWLWFLVMGSGWYKYLVMIVMIPSMTILSEKTEMIELGTDKTNLTNSWAEFFRLMGRGLRINVANLTKELFATIAVSLLFWLLYIPFETEIKYALVFGLQAYYAGFGNLDYALERYRDVKGSNEFVAKNAWAATWNGIPFLLMLYIPIVGIVLASAWATVAGTLFVVREEAKRP